MQQNGQEQQERERLQQITEQPEREGEPNSAASAQLEQQLTAEQQKVEECQDLLRRTQADFVNYRRRSPECAALPPVTGTR